MFYLFFSKNLANLFLQPIYNVTNVFAVILGDILRYNFQRQIQN